MTTPADKRKAVLEATLRVLAREGPRGITHRAIAKEAGTSLRATTYYFDSREHLLTAALRYYAETAMARFDGLAFELPDSPTDALEGASLLLAQIVMSDVVDDRAGLVAEYELVLEIGRNPSLEPAYRAWQAKLEEMLEGYAKLFGSKDPVGDSRLVLAALRGLEIEALSRPEQAPELEDLRRVFRRLLSALYGG